MVGELENSKIFANFFQYFYNNFAKMPAGLQEFFAKLVFLQSFLQLFCNIFAILQNLIAIVQIYLISYNLQQFCKFANFWIFAKSTSRFDSKILSPVGDLGLGWGGAKLIF